MSTAPSIRERVSAASGFSLAEVRRWIADESDLELWAAIYEVLGRGFYQVTPEPGMEETCEFMTRYLLRCVHEDITNDDVPSGYEAAYQLAASLKHWATKLPTTRPVLAGAVARITEAYRQANESQRDRLLNGTLEHALESPLVREYFRSWERDPELSEPWRLAMEWAIVHGDCP